MNNVGRKRDNDDSTIEQGAAGRSAKRPTPSVAASVAQQILSWFTSPTSAPSSPVLSASNLSPHMEETKEEAIKNRDGHLWQCVDRIEAEEGFIYKFKLRKEFDTSEHYVKANDPRVSGAEKKIKEIFPAIEGRVEAFADPRVWNWATYASGGKYPPDYLEMKGKLERGRIQAIPVPINNPEVNEVLLQMGYKMEIARDGIYLYLPDEKVLETRWNNMVSGYPERMVTIISSQEIATDEEFTDTFIKKEMVLSSGSEFVHDHQVHILSALSYMIDHPENYSQARERFSVLVAGLVEKIKKARGLIAEMVGKVGPTTSRENRAYINRLEKNMALANTIPAIVADELAAISLKTDLSKFELNRKLSSWKSSIYPFEKFVMNRHEKDISEKYQKENHGAEIPPKVLAAQMEGISLSWLFQEISKVLGE